MIPTAGTATNRQKVMLRTAPSVFSCSPCLSLKRSSPPAPSSSTMAYVPPSQARTVPSVAPTQPALLPEPESASRPKRKFWTPGMSAIASETRPARMSGFSRSVQCAGLTCATGAFGAATSSGVRSSDAADAETAEADSSSTTCADSPSSPSSLMAAGVLTERLTIGLRTALRCGSKGAPGVSPGASHAQSRRRARGCT